MLDFSDMDIIDITAGYKSVMWRNGMIVGIFAIASIFLFIRFMILINKKHKDASGIPFIITFAIASCFAIFSKAPCYDVFVKVIPNAEITEKYMKADENFVEKDGEMYFNFVVNKTGLFGPKRLYKSRGHVKDVCNEKFDFLVRGSYDKKVGIF